jgi:hypothetical protein
MQAFIVETKDGFEVHRVIKSEVYVTTTNKQDAEKLKASLTSGELIAAVPVPEKTGRLRTTTRRKTNAKKKGRGGRPKGSRNKPKETEVLVASSVLSGATEEDFEKTHVTDAAALQRAIREEPT